MLLKVLTNTAVTGVGAVECQANENAGILGGVLITTDNSTLGVVIIKRNDANGKEIMKISTVTTMFISGPFSMEGTNQIYYDVSGNNCSVHLYEWVT